MCGISVHIDLVKQGERNAIVQFAKILDAYGILQFLIVLLSTWKPKDFKSFTIHPLI